MGTTAREEQPNAETPNENQQTQTESTEQTSEQTQSSSETPTTDRAGRLLELYEQNLREAHQNSQRLQSELDRRDREAAAQAAGAPPNVPDINPSEFWNKPLPHIAQIIREETRKAVQPLYDFKEQIENETRYERLKTKFRNDVRYREIFPKIEGVVDQMVLNSGAEVNDALLNATILSAIGALHTGQLPGIELDVGTGRQPANRNGEPPPRTGESREATRVITPPHLRPNAAPQITGGDAKPKLRDLTELEDRLRRENNQTKEEFLQWLDLPSTEVATSTIGKPPKPDATTNPGSQVVRVAANPNQR